MIQRLLCAVTLSPPKLRTRTRLPIMTMAEKRPYSEGQGPNGDVKRAKPSDAVEAAKAKAKAKGKANGKR